MTRLERDLEALFEAQTRSLGVGTPPPLDEARQVDSTEAADDRPSVTRLVVVGGGADSDDDPDDRVFDLDPPTVNRIPVLPVLTAAAVVALIVSLVVVTARDDSERAPASPPSPAVTVPPAPSEAVRAATVFWEAVVAGDREAALAFIDPAPDFEEPQGLFGAAPTLERQFDWYEAVDWQWTLERCTPVDDGRARCRAAAENAWSEAMDVDPITGTFLMQFDDDGFLTLDSNFGERWLPQVYQPFNAWVSANHPEDAEIMWDSPDDVLSDEALELFEVNTERFVAAQLVKRSTTTTPTQEEP